MPFADPKHPIWTVAIGVVVIVALGLMLTFNYNQVDHRDITTLLVTATTYLVTTMTRGAVSKRFDASQQTGEEPCDRS